MKASTGLRNHMLESGSLKDALGGGFINLYTGAVPATADEAETAAPVCVISVGSAPSEGLNFGAALNGAISKANETWSGEAGGSGPYTLTHFRFVTDSDTGEYSTAEKRLQGTVGTAGADMNLDSVVLSSNATRVLDFFSVALPTA